MVRQAHHEKAGINFEKALVPVNRVRAVAGDMLFLTGSNKSVEDWGES